MNSKLRLVDYLTLYFDILIYSMSAVFAKFAAGQDSIMFSFFFIGGEVLLLVIYAVIWQQVLKKFEMAVAVSSKGITVVWGMVWSVLIFHEIITIWNILGAIVIMTGIWMVSAYE